MLTGTHFVRALRSGMQSAKAFWPRTSERMEVRRHALKLRFWGERHDRSSTVLDLSYEAIKSMSGSGVYEMRVDDEIGGRRNIRIVFLDPPKNWVQVIETPLPMIWIMEALPKKRDDWTKYDINRFWAKRAIIHERFYHS